MEYLPTSSSESDSRSLDISSKSFSENEEVGEEVNQQAVGDVGKCRLNDQIVDLPSADFLALSDDEDDGLNISKDDVNPVDPKFYVKQEFASRFTFRTALLHYAVYHGFELLFKKNDKVRVTATVDCPWRIYALVHQDEMIFIVKSLRDEHKCTTVNHSGIMTAMSKWIAQANDNDVHTNPNVKIRDLQNMCVQKYHLKLSYHRTWLGRETTREKVVRNFEDSYANLPSLKVSVLDKNLGSVVNLECEGLKSRFKRFFVCFAASSLGFTAGCRNFIGLDGCHIRNKYKGALLAAIATDGNSGLFPLAFAIVEGENINSWEWFLTNSRNAINFSREPVIMSNRQKGLVDAVHRIFPCTMHQFCVRHLYKNFQTQFRGRFLKDMFWKAAHAYMPFEFHEAMEKIKEHNEDAHKWISKVPPSCWTRSHFEDDSYVENVTNNQTESFNAFIFDCRSLPIVDMINSIRVKFMQTMSRRQAMASTWTTKVVLHVVKRLKVIEREARECTPIVASLNMFEVISPEGTVVVDIHHGSCSCRRWLVTGLPCKHAAACLLRDRHNLEDYCAPFFSVQAYQKTYEHIIYPMEDKRFWTRIDATVLPPMTRRPPGRPKSLRIRGDDESRSATSQTTKCKRCGGLGHNRRTCKAPLNQDSSSQQPATLNPTCDPQQASSHARHVGSSSQGVDSSSQGVDTSQARPNRRVGATNCTLCHQPGHNRRTCTRK